jgi:N-acetylglucosamine-6-phosphate deacetylase
LLKQREEKYMMLNQPPHRFALSNGRIVLPDAIVLGKAVVMEGERIAGIAGAGELGQDTVEIDVAGRYITPGLIDIHTHGALGHTFNQPVEKAFEAITRENARRGVTALVATLAPAPIPDLVRCLEFCQGWTSQKHGGSQVLGMHLESPYVSPAQKGALDPRNLHAPGDGTADALLEHHDVIKVFVVAPELPGALQLIHRLSDLSIVPAAGHSMAKEEEIRAAMGEGLRHVTHIWSAMSSVVREGPWRKPGLLEAALTFDGLTVEMIADNKHLPPTLMKLAYKCIGADRLCAISDATSGAGLPDGARFQMGEMEYEVRDGVGMMLDRSSFAGGAKLVNEMIAILTDVVGIPLVEAIRMLTLTPARAIGVNRQRGSIEPGKCADLAIFDEDWTAWRTMIGGRWAWPRELDRE